ncbi:MAG: Rieske 2Fe-2S domain-containing protein [Candidatus Electryonea clarkiae]|nr:Rieske 2Fe-2S domain-containing protein [Candidatus Electryonea clarkiae]MDP8285309.1 Rieske 2Fe-2S domain-containing protein [Candidatus Electryonea clarkiae]
MSEKFVNVCLDSELEEGSTKFVEANGRAILIARHNGEVHALSGLCTHDGGLMDGEHVANGQVTCERHGACFDVKTGEVTQLPAVYGLAPYTVKVEDGNIYVEAG